MASSRRASAAEPLAARLEATVRAELDALRPRAKRVVAALSGGVDSIVLLDLLRKAAPPCGFELTALHVNHGLSPQAARWERFCRMHCARRRIAFAAVRVRVGGGGSNVEAEARAARYRAFAAADADVVALAHHLDDQAETLLLGLLRGSGLQGLAGMPRERPLARPSVRARASKRLLRPLLAVSRADIVSYARSRRLTWIEDESNADTRFARNFLRREVFPLLCSRFPACAAAFARSAEHLRSASELMDAIAADDLAACRDGARLHAPRLLALGELRATNVLRHFVALSGARPPGLARSRELLRQLTRARHDAQPVIVLGEASVRRHRDWIELVRESVQWTPFAPLRWDGERVVELPGAGEVIVRPTRGGGGVSAAQLRTAPVSIRPRTGGERIRLAANARTRTLKNLLQEARVVPWTRVRLPLLFCGEELVWAPYVGIAERYRAKAGEPGWRFSWREPEGI